MVYIILIQIYVLRMDGTLGLTLVECEFGKGLAISLSLIGIIRSYTAICGRKFDSFVSAWHPFVIDFLSQQEIDLLFFSGYHVKIFRETLQFAILLKQKNCCGLAFPYSTVFERDFAFDGDRAFLEVVLRGEVDTDITRFGQSQLIYFFECSASCLNHDFMLGLTGLPLAIHILL